MARILCIETATHLCSVALVEDDRLLAERNAEEHDRFIHAERLNVMVDEGMKEARLNMRHLDAVAVGIGPGSYTGLRIGLSAAKGYCYALGIPIMGIGTLDTLTGAIRSMNYEQRPAGSEELHPMIDARRMEVFTGDPPRPVVLDEGWIASLDPKRAHVMFGDGADKAADLWKSKEPSGSPPPAPPIAHGTSQQDGRRAGIIHVPGIKPWARAMASVAVARFSEKRFDDLAYLVPVYGKEAKVTKPGPAEGARSHEP